MQKKFHPDRLQDSLGINFAWRASEPKGRELPLKRGNKRPTQGSGALRSGWKCMRISGVRSGEGKNKATDSRLQPFSMRNLYSSPKNRSTTCISFSSYQSHLLIIVVCVKCSNKQLLFFSLPSILKLSFYRMPLESDTGNWESILCSRSKLLPLMNVSVIYSYLWIFYGTHHSSTWVNPYPRFSLVMVCIALMSP